MSRRDHSHISACLKCRSRMRLPILFVGHHHALDFRSVPRAGGERSETSLPITSGALDAYKSSGRHGHPGCMVPRLNRSYSARALSASPRAWRREADQLVAVKHRRILNRRILFRLGFQPATLMVWRWHSHCRCFHQIAGALSQR